MAIFRLTVVFLFLFTFVSAQSPIGLSIRKANGPITIDGKMEETAWQLADVADHFKQYFPFDSSYAKAQTEVRMTYDDRFVYVFAIMHNLGPRKYVTPSLRRDFRGEANDGFSIVLDTYNDNTNAFQFGVNPYGVQREGLISNGGATPEDLSLNWDNKWFSEVMMLEDRWVCEMAIPFKTIRFKQNVASWNINFYRVDSEYNERSTWVPIPRIYRIYSLAFVRTLHWDQPLANPGGNVSVIPYSAAKVTRDFEEGIPRQSEIDIGGDAKIALSSALNLDLTVNPDFSQVEVDQQVTNLDRFEIFFPERRQFFLENADLFGSFGYSNARPFFSRRIGVTRDPSTGQNIQNAIYGGARVSGKINNNWRMGVLDMQAAEDNSINLPSLNYAVAAVQRKIFSRSNIGVMAINKQSFDTSAYNRLLGIDYNLASKNNKWNGKFFYHRSFDNAKKDSAYATTANINYQVPAYELSLLYQDIGANFNPEVGYVRRTRYQRFAPEGYYYFYPQSKIINNHGPGFDIDYQWNDLYNTTDWDANIWYKIKFQNTASFFTRLRRDYVYLFADFDPSGSEGIALPAGTNYYWNSVIINYQSNGRKKLFFNFQSRLGEYYNGYRQNIEGSLSYRVQPYVVFSIDFSFNRIRLPDPYNDSDLVLLGPKFDFTFSRKLFWTTYVQYNNQISNMNINSRLQWRFRPVSDLFLVYTDNYFAESFENGNILRVGAPKFRSLVLKFTYWLNL